YVSRVRTFVNALATRYPGITVDVAAFDQETKPVFSGPAASFGDAEVAALVERRADGASDLGQALVATKPNARVVVIGDGVVTAASWVYPRIIPSVRAGTQVVIYAQTGAPRTELVASFGGVPHTAVVHSGTPAFVERAAARAEIEDLEAQRDATTDPKAQGTL